MERRWDTLMGRLGALLIPLGATAAVAITRHGLRAGHKTPGGILVRHACAYAALSRRMLRSFFKRIADDVAEAAPESARILEVGCGPGHLSIQLAGWHGFDLTGIDLDPAMIDQAQANVIPADDINKASPSFQVGDVAQLAFPDESFDLIVSTLSMHHWADPGAGLSEIGRVLRPGGRALIWDFRPGIWPFHRRIPEAVQHTQGSRLQIVQATPWRWPWKLSLTQRIELARPEDPAHHSEPKPIRRLATKEKHNG